MKALIIISFGALIAIEYICCVQNKRKEKQAEELYKRYKEWKEHERETGRSDLS